MVDTFHIWSCISVLGVLCINPKEQGATRLNIREVSETYSSSVEGLHVALQLPVTGIKEQKMCSPSGRILLGSRPLHCFVLPALGPRSPL